MHRFILPLALASHALAGIIETRADAGVLQFVDGDWEDKCEGEVFPIKWSKGNGKNVAVSVKGQGWEDEICDSEVAPGGLDWTVKVPKCDAEYSLWLKQEDCEELESPKFMVNCAEEEEEAPSHGNWTDAPEKPSITVVWQDGECECEKTKVTVAPTPSKSVWYDNELSCSVTATEPACKGPNCGGAPVAPAATSAAPTWNKPVAPTAAPAAPAAPVAPAAVSPAAPAAPVAPAAVSPAAVSPAKPVAPAAYTGAASKLGGSAFALVAVFAAALAL